MFTDHQMTRAFVTERQTALRNEVRRDRLARGIRRRRRIARHLVEDRTAA